MGLNHARQEGRMLCDRCGQREATHHDLVVDGSEVQETHLCEPCAQFVAGQGKGAEPEGESPATLGDWLTNFVLTPPVPGAGQTSGGTPPGGGAAGRKRAATSCTSCGLTFAELKKSGLVGCEHCYTVFESRLLPLVQRAHEGGARHVGKQPSRWVPGGSAAGGDAGADEGDGGESSAGPRTVAQEVEVLRAALAEAVATEAYEEAAALRDRLEALLRGGSQGSGPGGGD